MKITPLEKDMIVNIAENEYTNGDPSASVWSDCLECGPVDIEPAQYGGIIASLVKKGIVKQSDYSQFATVQLTAIGLNAYHDIKGA